MTLAVLLQVIAPIRHDLHRIGVWLALLKGNQSGVLGHPMTLPVLLFRLPAEAADAGASAAADGHGAVVHLAVRHFAASPFLKLQ